MKLRSTQKTQSFQQCTNKWLYFSLDLTNLRLNKTHRTSYSLFNHLKCKIHGVSPQISIYNAVQLTASVTNYFPHPNRNLLSIQWLPPTLLTELIGTFNLHGTQSCGLCVWLTSIQHNVIMIHWTHICTSPIFIINVSLYKQPTICLLVVRQTL